MKQLSLYPNPLHHLHLNIYYFKKYISLKSNQHIPDMCPTIFFFPL